MVLAFGIYRGPVYWSVRAGPGPPEETYSLPLQQLARIAKYQSRRLTSQEVRYYTQMFAGMSAQQLGEHYVPVLADPMKLQGRKSWADHSTAEFLTGWAAIAARFPGTAIEATLAGTIGYWIRRPRRTTARTGGPTTTSAESTSTSLLVAPPAAPRPPSWQADWFRPGTTSTAYTTTAIDRSPYSA